MLFKGKEGLQLAVQKVKYLQHGETKEQEVASEGKQWWIDFEQKHEDMKIIEFININYTDEQISRLQEVKNFKYLTENVENYVLKGTYDATENVGEEPTTSNAELLQLKIKKENDDLQDIIAGLIGGVM